MPARIFHHLFELWNERDRQDEYIGTLVNAWLARGGVAQGVRAGESYVDIGTLHGYRAAISLLSSIPPERTNQVSPIPRSLPKRTEPILSVHNE